MPEEFKSNIACARRSWERVLAVTDPDGQQVMRALWATVWAKVLLAEAGTNSNPVIPPDAEAHHERHNLPANSPGLPPTFPIVGPHPGDDARRGVISPRSRPAALPDVGAGEV
jgi:hypothetical protein